MGNYGYLRYAPELLRRTFSYLEFCSGCVFESDIDYTTFSGTAMGLYSSGFTPCDKQAIDYTTFYILDLVNASITGSTFDNEYWTGNSGNIIASSTTVTNVGIGTVSPNTKLTVNGVVSSTTSMAAHNFVSTGASNPSAGYTFNSLYLRFQTAYTSTYIGFSVPSGFDTNSTKNTVVGHGAMGNATLNTATDNTGLGYRTFYDITSGDRNVAIGKTASYNLTSGGDNVHVGANAGFTSSVGNYNVFIGSAAGYYSDGVGTNSNTAVGRNAMLNSKAGKHNTTMGHNSMYGNGAFPGGTGNTAMGSNSLSAIRDGKYNTTIGFDAGDSITTGSGNTTLGAGAGDNIVNGSHNIAIGSGTTILDGSESWRLNIGNIIYGRDLSSINSINAVGIGTQDPTNRLHVVGHEEEDNPLRLETLSTGRGNIVVADAQGVLYKSQTSSGHTAGFWTAATGVISNSGLTGNSVAVGTNSPNSLFEVKDYITFYTGSSEANTFIGYHSGMNYNDDMEKNVGIGHQVMALAAKTTGINAPQENTAVGYHSLKHITQGKLNTAIGTDSLQELTTGQYNVGIGAEAGSGLTTQEYNIAIGSLTLRHMDGTAAGRPARHNIAIGHNSQTYNPLGVFNTCVGGFTLGNTYGNAGGTGNTVMGYGALKTQGGNYNVAIGLEVGRAVTVGSGNTLLGYKVADNLTTGNHNIIIGYDIDAVEIDTDNSLNIGKAIYGTGIGSYGAKIGINTTTPNIVGLQVAGDISGSTISANTSVYAQETMTAQTIASVTTLSAMGDTHTHGDIYVDEDKKIYFDSTDTYIYANTNTFENLLIGADNNIILEPDNDLTIKVGGTQYARFFGAEKKVRIGTTSSTSPIAELEVVGTVSADTAIINDKVGIATGTPMTALHVVNDYGNGIGTPDWGLDEGQGGGEVLKYGRFNSAITAEGLIVMLVNSGGTSAWYKADARNPADTRIAHLVGVALDTYDSGDVNKTATVLLRGFVRIDSTLWNGTTANSSRGSQVYVSPDANGEWTNDVSDFDTTNDVMRGMGNLIVRDPSSPNDYFIWFNPDQNYIKIQA